MVKNKKTRLRTFIDVEFNMFNSFFKNKNNFHFNQKKKNLRFFVYLNSYIKFLKKYACFLRTYSFLLKKKKVINPFKFKIDDLLKKKYNINVNTFKILNLKTKYVCTFNSSVKYSSYIRIFNKNFILFNKDLIVYDFNALGVDDNIEGNKTTTYSFENDNTGVVSSITDMSESENTGNDNASVTDMSESENTDNDDASVTDMSENDDVVSITNTLKSVNDNNGRHFAVNYNNTNSFKSKNYINCSNKSFFYKFTALTRFRIKRYNCIIKNCLKKEFKNLFNFYMNELFFKQYLKYFKNSNLINKPVTIEFKLLNVFSKELILFKKYKNLNRYVKLNRLYVK